MRSQDGCRRRRGRRRRWQRHRGPAARRDGPRADGPDVPAAGWGRARRGSPSRRGAAPPRGRRRRVPAGCGGRVGGRGQVAGTSRIGRRGAVGRGARAGGAGGREGGVRAHAAGAGGAADAGRGGVPADHGRRCRQGDGQARPGSPGSDGANACRREQAGDGSAHAAARRPGRGGGSRPALADACGDRIGEGGRERRRRVGGAHRGSSKQGSPPATPSARTGSARPRPAASSAAPSALACAASRALAAASASATAPSGGWTASQRSGGSSATSTSGHPGTAERVRPADAAPELGLVDARRRALDAHVGAARDVDARDGPARPREERGTGDAEPSRRGGRRARVGVGGRPCGDCRAAAVYVSVTDRASFVT